MHILFIISFIHVYPFFFLYYNNSVTDFSASILARAFNFYFHLVGVKDNQDAYSNFCILFPFLPFSIPHFCFMHMAIFTNDISGTTSPRGLNFFCKPQPLYNTVRYNTVWDIIRIIFGPQLVNLCIFSYTYYSPYNTVWMANTEFGLDPNK